MPVADVENWSMPCSAKKRAVRCMNFRFSRIEIASSGQP